MPTKKTPLKVFFLLAGLGGYARFARRFLRNAPLKSPRTLCSCFFAVRIPKIHANKKDTFKGVFFIGWAGRIRTAEMPESKSGALPLGYSPIKMKLCGVISDCVLYVV